MRKSCPVWLGLCVIGAAVLIPRNCCRAQIVTPQGPRIVGNGPVAQPVPQQPGNVNVNVNVSNQNGEQFFNGRWQKAPEVVTELKVEGYGLTTDDAVEQAVKASCDKVREFLQKTYGETQYDPTPEKLTDLKV